MDAGTVVMHRKGEELVLDDVEAADGWTVSVDDGKDDRDEVELERDLALVVSGALVGICIWATVVGSALPFAARRLGIDPAVVSAPLVTTLVDAAGLLIYFGFAWLILGV